MCFMFNVKWNIINVITATNQDMFVINNFVLITEPI